ELGYCLMKFHFKQGIIVSAYIWACIGLLIYLHSRKLITPGDFAFVITINFKIIDYLFDLSHQLREVITDWGKIDQALLLLELPVEIQDKPGASTLKVTKGRIVFDKVK